MAELFRLTTFVANPGKLAKSEVGEAVTTLLIYLDGVCLPPNNEVVHKFRTFKSEIAPRDRPNGFVLEQLAGLLGKYGRQLPGVARVIETNAKNQADWRIREGLGTDFQRWCRFATRRTTEGVIVDLGMTSDPYRSVEWAQCFNMKTIRRKLNYSPLKTSISEVGLKTSL